MVKPRDQGSAFFSNGFRPMFLGAALFAGIAVPVWVAILTEGLHPAFVYPPRDWHVHEMLFGFLPAVMTGFLLTAIPNWTERPPLTGLRLMLLSGLWMAGRITVAVPWPTPRLSAVVDGAFLVVVSALVWREIAEGKAWDRSPIGVLISLYAGANILFHLHALRGEETDLAERMALGLIMLLLALIGGRITPNFTTDYLTREGSTVKPPPFSSVDGGAMALTGVAAVFWMVEPAATGTAWALLAAGTANLVRLSRWRGWSTWREPLVLILHLGYGWLALSLLAMGGAILGVALKPAEAVHALATGAVGVTTLAVMTRASLGHTGQPLHAGSLTVLMYLLVNLGAFLRVLGPASGLPSPLVLGLAALAWSGAYLLFAVLYGPSLGRPSLDE